MHIDIVLTGGTIGSKVDNGSAEIAQDFDLSALTDGKPHTFRQHCPFLIHSENLVPEHWQKLYETINSIKTSDGVIVLHGTDTLVYTAAFLSFAFADCPFPIILVSSHSPLCDPTTNAKNNFDMAVCAIENAVKGVYVSYKNDGAPEMLFAANKIANFLPFVHTLNAVEAPYAIMQDSDFVIVGKPFFEKQIEPKFPVNRVTLIAAAIAVDFSAYLQCDNQPDCYLVELFHSSTCSVSRTHPKYSFAYFSEQCAERGIKVFVAPFQARDYYYPSKSTIQNTLFFEGMTLHAAYTKLLIGDLTEK
jgi:L-asparaginase